MLHALHSVRLPTPDEARQTCMHFITHLTVDRASVFPIFYLRKASLQNARESWRYRRDVPNFSQRCQFGPICFVTWCASRPPKSTPFGYVFDARCTWRPGAGVGRGPAASARKVGACRRFSLHSIKNCTYVVHSKLSQLPQATYQTSSSITDTRTTWAWLASVTRYADGLNPDTFSPVSVSLVTTPSMHFLVMVSKSADPS